MSNCETLLSDILSLNRGYVTIRSGEYDIAFAAKNAKGYVNIKVRHHEFTKFVTFGYLDISRREARTNPWCEVRDPGKVQDILILVKDVLAGRRSFADAPNPRGKPPGAKSGYKRSGYQRSAPREDIREDNSTPPPTGDIAGLVAALQTERDNLAYKVAAMEKEIAALRDAESRAYQRGKSEAEPANFTRSAERVTLDGKAAKVFAQAVGEYKVGNIQAAANMAAVVMRMVN